MTGVDNSTHIEQALRANRSQLKRFVASRAPDVDVDDILQVAAMRAVVNAHALDDPERVVPWLFQIHRNVAIDFARDMAREQRRRAVLAAEPVLLETEEETSICACSVEQAGRLNARYASILKLVDMSGVSLKEAARVLGVTVNTATVRLHRARAALKKRLLDHCGVVTMRECTDCRCTSDGCCPT